MHRAVATAFTAIVVAAFLATPRLTYAAQDPGDTYVDSIANADVVLIGQALEVHPGRAVNGCQFTAATVRIEEVILGELASSAPGDLTVEFVGDCKEVAALGGAVPTERAIWFLVNTGSWLREFVVPQSGDWSEEVAYWRPLGPDAIAVDHGGALGKHGTGLNWLPSVTFGEFVGGIRDSAYLRQSYGPQAPVGLGIWFSAQSYLATAALFVVASLAAARALIVRCDGRRRRTTTVR